MMTLGSAAYELTIDRSAFDRGLKDAEGIARRSTSAIGGIFGGLTSAFTAPLRSLGGLTDGLGKLGLATVGLGAIKGAVQDAFGALSSPIQAASDLSESMNKVDVVFGSSAQSIKDFSATAAQSLGQSQGEALAAAGQFGNLFKAMGLGQDETTQLSKEIVGLGSDLASFHNIKPEEALEKLRAGLVGESEPLRALGVNINETLVKEKALALGFKEANGQLSESAKVQARYALILEQTKDAQGDFARTSDGMANAQRIISASFKDLQVQLGQQFLPLIAPVISAFAKGLPGAMQAAQPVLAGLGASLAEFVDRLKPMGKVLMDAFGTVQQVFAGDWSPDESIDPLVNTLGMLATVVRDDVLPLLSRLGDVATKTLGGDFAGALSGLGDLVTDFGPKLVEQLGGWAEAFLGWVGPLVPPLLAQLAEMSARVYVWMYGTALPSIIEQLSRWAAAFVDWVAPQIPPLLRELGGLLTQLAGWLLGTALPAIATKLAEWGLAFVEWVGPRIPPLLLELGKLLLDLNAWIIKTALPAITGKLGEWGLAFLSWIYAMPDGVIWRLPGALDRITTALGEWIRDTALPWLGREVPKLGASMVGEIQNGISGALAAFKQWITDNLLAAIPQWARDILGIKSPSSIFAAIGGQIVEGLKRGIEAKWPSAEELMRRLLGAFGDLGANVAGDVADWLRAAMAIAGVGSDWFGGLARLVQIESGGNPRAVNPQAVSNGEHATGLLQTIPSTFRAYRLPGLDDIFNPIHNAVAAIRYIQARYGHVDRALQGHAQRGGYATGGIAWKPQLARVAEREPELIIPFSKLGLSPAAMGRIRQPSLLADLGHYRDEWVDRARDEHLHELRDSHDDNSKTVQVTVNADRHDRGTIASGVMEGLFAAHSEMQRAGLA